MQAMTDQAIRDGDEIKVQLTPGSVAILAAKAKAKADAETAFNDALTTTLVAVGITGYFKNLDLQTGIVTYTPPSLAAVPNEEGGS